MEIHQFYVVSVVLTWRAGSTQLVVNSDECYELCQQKFKLFIVGHSICPVHPFWACHSFRVVLLVASVEAQLFGSQDIMISHVLCPLLTVRFRFQCFEKSDCRWRTWLLGTFLTVSSSQDQKFVKHFVTCGCDFRHVRWEQCIRSTQRIRFDNAINTYYWYDFFWRLFLIPPWIQDCLPIVISLISEGGGVRHFVSPRQAVFVNVLNACDFLQCGTKFVVHFKVPSSICSSVTKIN